MRQEPEGFENEYAESHFWEKLGGYARTAGREVVERALQLYYAAQSPETPLWAKSTIYGALGYFISVVDAIPDVTPIVGYTDDLGVLVAAVAAVASSITPEMRERAARKAREWFPE